MRYINWILGMLLFLLALGFAVKNSDPATLVLYLGYRWEAPLILLILVFFFAGVAAGVAACTAALLRQRQIIRRLKGQAAPLHGPLPQEPTGSGTHGV